MLKNYIINDETLLLIPYFYNGANITKVYEFDEELLVEKLPYEIIKESCLFFDSSFEGRRDGTMALINCKMKVPVIIEESRKILFFPTCSIENSNNMWISYNNMINFNKVDSKETVINFKKNKSIMVNVKYNLIDNQFVRCIKLDSVISNRFDKHLY